MDCVKRPSSIVKLWWALQATLPVSGNSDVTSSFFANGQQKEGIFGTLFSYLSLMGKRHYSNIKCCDKLVKLLIMSEFLLPIEKAFSEEIIPS